MYIDENSVEALIKMGFIFIALFVAFIVFVVLPRGCALNIIFFAIVIFLIWWLHG